MSGSSKVRPVSGGAVAFGVALLFGCGAFGFYQLAQVTGIGPSGRASLQGAVIEAEVSSVSLIEYVANSETPLGTDVEIDPDTIWDLIDQNDPADFFSARG